MRTIGFVLVLLGIVTIYLAVKGKVGAAVQALFTGQVPSDSSSNQDIGKAFNNDPLSRGDLPAGTPNQT